MFSKKTKLAIEGQNHELNCAENGEGIPHVLDRGFPLANLAKRVTLGFSIDMY